MVFMDLMLTVFYMACDLISMMLLLRLILPCVFSMSDQNLSVRAIIHSTDRLIKPLHASISSYTQCTESGLLIGSLIALACFQSMVIVLSSTQANVWFIVFLVWVLKILVRHIAALGLISVGIEWLSPYLSLPDSLKTMVKTLNQPLFLCLNTMLSLHLPRTVALTVYAVFFFTILILISV